jgi:hypothetical protein
MVMQIVKNDTQFGRDLLESLQEVRDHLDGKLALPGRVAAPTALIAKDPEAVERPPAEE